MFIDQRFGPDVARWNRSGQNNVYISGGVEQFAMRDHLKILGILNIVLGTLTALVGIIALLAMGTLAGFVAAGLPSVDGSDYHNARIAAPIIAGVGFGIAIFFILLGLPAIIGGWGLMNYRPWSRILMIVISVFDLFHIPVGTALGIYGLWVLLSPEGKALLETGGVYPASAQAIRGYGPGAHVRAPDRADSQDYAPPPPSPPTS